MWTDFDSMCNLIVMNLWQMQMFVFVYIFCFNKIISSVFEIRVVMFCFTGADNSSTNIASLSGIHYASIDLPSKFNSFTQPPADTFPTKVSSGPVMFLDFLSDELHTHDGVKVYVNLLLESMFFNIYSTYKENQVIYIQLVFSYLCFFGVGWSEGWCLYTLGKQGCNTPGWYVFFCDYVYFISPRGLRTGCMV